MSVKVIQVIEKESFNYDGNPYKEYLSLDGICLGSSVNRPMIDVSDLMQALDEYYQKESTKDLTRHTSHRMATELIDIIKNKHRGF